MWTDRRPLYGTVAHGPVQIGSPHPVKTRVDTAGHCGRSTRDTDVPVHRNGFTVTCGSLSQPSRNVAAGPREVFLATRSVAEPAPRAWRTIRSTIRSHVRNVFPFPRPYRPPYGELVTHSRLFRRHFPDSDRGSEVSYYRNGTVDHLRSSNGWVARRWVRPSAGLEPVGASEHWAQTVSHIKVSAFHECTIRDRVIEAVWRRVTSEYKYEKKNKIWFLPMARGRE